MSKFHSFSSIVGFLKKFEVSYTAKYTHFKCSVHLLGGMFWNSPLSSSRVFASPKRKPCPHQQSPSALPSPRRHSPASCLRTCLSWTCRTNGVSPCGRCVRRCSLSAVCSGSVHVVVSASASPPFVAEWHYPMWTGMGRCVLHPQMDTRVVLPFGCVSLLP